MTRTSEPAGGELVSSGRGGAKRVALAIFIVAGMAVFLGLGVWQVQRLSWKLDLIRTVDERIHAEPVDAPGPQSWSGLNAKDDAYRHVRLKGHFTGIRPVFVKAVTELGPGFWVVEPFETDDGFAVLVNRGFVSGAQSAGLPPASPVPTVVTGLLRVTEPEGAFLRSNDPVQDRWYSRDVEAIAAARGVEGAAPYFVDADASPSSSDVPVGGLTVVTFRNHHLVYALTWFGLAAMLAGWTVYLVRQRKSDAKPVSR